MCGKWWLWRRTRTSGSQEGPSNLGTVLGQRPEAIWDEGYNAALAGRAMGTNPFRTGEAEFLATRAARFPDAPPEGSTPGSSAIRGSGEEFAEILERERGDNPEEFQAFLERKRAARPRKESRPNRSGSPEPIHRSPLPRPQAPAKPVAAARGLGTGHSHTTQVHRSRACAPISLRLRDHQALPAPRLLDEDIDVPDADLAIISATSSQRNQMIQRITHISRLKDGVGGHGFCGSTSLTPADRQGENGAHEVPRRYCGHC